ncbi:MAG TPA: hypothetical protein VG944_03465 [Fimbriimonas sp.]|nr:hypothetical protein [Fimbriimonas sp.]
MSVHPISGSHNSGSKSGVGNISAPFPSIIFGPGGGNRTSPSAGSNPGSIKKGGGGFGEPTDGRLTDHPVVITGLPTGKIPPPFHGKPIEVHPLPGRRSHHHHGDFVGGWRFDFWSYWDLSDDFFCCNCYQYDPSDEQDPQFSPWYFYPNLPPYLERVKTLPPSDVDAGDLLPSDGPVVAPNPTAKLALDDLIAMWVKNDRIAIGHLVPSKGSIEVLVEGKSQYDLKASDFYDLLHDGTVNTKTTDYKVVALKAVDDHTLQVRARHTFLDPWDVERTIYHTYTLKLEGDRYVIRSFGSGSYAGDQQG